MDRRPTTQDISWLLDLRKTGQINLDPPYQRRSVWTPKDRRFFLDTIFRNYPSPAIFLHKNLNPDGVSTYHVVDGKQRLETIFSFVENKIRIAPDFGDARLDGKRWIDINNEMELKVRFWNYQVSVEMIDFPAADTVKNVFDRLNRNSRRLTQQELRHAKYDGWFIQRAEQEAEAPIWRDVGISTRTRANRMIDVQFVSELMLVVLNKKMSGFSQEELDETYAEYDDLAEVEAFNEESFLDLLEKGKQILADIERHNNAVSRYAKGSVGAVYSLWSFIVLEENIPRAEIIAQRYESFMAAVELLGMGIDPANEMSAAASRYRENARGASTELSQRQQRYNALREALLGL